MVKGERVRHAGQIPEHEMESYVGTEILLVKSLLRRIYPAIVASDASRLIPFTLTGATNAIGLDFAYTRMKGRGSLRRHDKLGNEMRWNFSNNPRIKTAEQTVTCNSANRFNELMIVTRNGLFRTPDGAKIASFGKIELFHSSGGKLEASVEIEREAFHFEAYADKFPTLWTKYPVSGLIKGDFDHAGRLLES